MSLYKNELPILERDEDTKAVIMPGHGWDYQFPERAVMMYMNDEIHTYASKHGAVKVGEFDSVMGISPVYRLNHNGVELALVQAPLGGPAAVMFMEQLWAGGARKIISCGCCGALLEDTAGTYYIPTAALRQEGTSYQYLPPSREVETDETAVRAIETALNKAGVPHCRCKTWTTDCFYRETKAMVNQRKSEGYAVVEMECASTAACAKFRGIQFAQLLFTADTLANVEEHDTRNWAKECFVNALKLALDAAAEM